MDELYARRQAMALVTAAAIGDDRLFLELWRETPTEERPQVVGCLACLGVGAIQRAADLQDEELEAILGRVGLVMAQEV